MSKKFALPHSEKKIKELEEQAKKIRVQIEAMTSENWLAQQSENIRKARIMTPGMLKALKKLAEGRTVTVTKYYGRNGQHRISINSVVFDRLRRAEFIVLDKERSRHLDEYYVITDLGREALANAKQTAKS